MKSKLSKALLSVGAAIVCFVILFGQLLFRSEPWGAFANISILGTGLLLVIISMKLKTKKTSQGQMHPNQKMKADEM